MIGIKYCGTGYWGLNFIMFVICGVYIKILIDRLKEKDSKLERLGYVFHPSEVRISTKSPNYDENGE